MELAEYLSCPLPCVTARLGLLGIGSVDRVAHQSTHAGPTPCCLAPQSGVLWIGQADRYPSHARMIPSPTNVIPLALENMTAPWTPKVRGGLTDATGLPIVRTSYGQQGVTNGRRDARHEERGEA